jgi:biotin carboxyl carrier protein
VSQSEDCAIAKDESTLDRYVAGEVEGEEQRELAAHLMTCTACVREVARLRRERALFAERATIKEETSMMWDKIAPQIAPRASRRVAVVGGLVAVAAGALLFLRLSGTAPTNAPVLATATQAPSAAVPVPSEPSGPHLSLKMRVRELPGIERLEYTTSGAPQIEVESVAGEVAIDATTSNTVKVSLQRTDDQPIDESWWVLVDDRDGIKVRVWCTALDCGHAPKIRIGLDVPIHAKIIARAVSAEVAVHGGDGGIVAKTDSGMLMIGKARNFVAKTVSGSIGLDTPANVKGEAKTTSGQVEWAGLCGAACEMKIKTVSGGVEISADGPIDVDWKTVSGRARKLTDDGERDLGKVAHIVHSVTGDPGHATVETVSGRVTIDEHEPMSRNAGEKSEPAAELDAFEKAHPELWLTSPIRGTVRKVLVAAGDHVHKGDMLVQLESSAERAEAMAVEAEIRAADAQYEQYRKMEKLGAATPMQVAEARGKLEIARARLAPLRALAERAKIVAPRDGVVREVLARAGDKVIEGSALIQLRAADAEPASAASSENGERERSVRCDVVEPTDWLPSTEAAAGIYVAAFPLGNLRRQVHRGQRVWMKTDAPIRRFEGTVVHVQPSSAQTDVVIKVASPRDLAIGDGLTCTFDPK